MKRRKNNLIGHILRRNSLIRSVIEGNIEGRTEVTGRRGRICTYLPDGLKEMRKYWELKEKVAYRTLRKRLWHLS